MRHWTLVEFRAATAAIGQERKIRQSDWSSSASTVRKSGCST